MTQQNKALHNSGIHEEPSIFGELVLSGQNPLVIDGPVLPDRDNPAVAYLTGLGSAKSRDTMSSVLNTAAKTLYAPSFRYCNWRELRRTHVQAVLATLRDANRAPATINMYLSALKGVAHEAWTMKQLDTDSYLHIKDIRSAKGTRLPPGRALDRDEQNALIFACEEKQDDPKGIRDAAIFSLMLGCGLRRSEVVDLDIEHLGMFQGDTSMRVLGKGNKERLAFMPKGTLQRLNKWIDVRGRRAGPLFLRIRRHGTLTDERLTDQAIYYLLKQRSIEAGLKEEVTPHDLRRTFASALLSDGEDLLTVRDALGHSSVSTTQRYDHRGIERLRDASKRLEIGVQK